MRRKLWGREMRSVFLVAATAVLGVSVTGCGLFGGDDTVVEQPVVEESPVASSPSPTASPQPFPDPTVEPQNTPRGILPPDLISSTDPNQRVQQVKGNRSDPFSLLPTTPTVTLAEGATPPTALPKTTALPPTGRTVATPPTRQPQTAPGSTAASGSKRPGSGTTAAGGAGGVKPGPKSPIANNPPRPQPTLARAVEVTGVVQVGDQVYAIVNAPNEPASRYVQEGQRLAGGQVLVRRIETNRADPVVILEQQGVEVVRAVGESGAAATSPGAPTPAT